MSYSNLQWWHSRAWTGCMYHAPLNKGLRQQPYLTTRENRAVDTAEIGIEITRRCLVVSTTNKSLFLWTSWLCRLSTRSM